MRRVKAFWFAQFYALCSLAVLLLSGCEITGKVDSKSSEASPPQQGSVEVKSFDFGNMTCKYWPGKETDEMPGTIVICHASDDKYHQFFIPQVKP